VIASNALHTASDLTTSMLRVSKLLADGGQLLAVELTNPEPVACVFGLLDSFWTASDKALRPGAPLLGREGWAHLLADCELRDVVFAGDTQEPAASDCAVILAARSPRARRLSRLDRHPPPRYPGSGSSPPLTGTAPRLPR
jgi:hypothetical protein